jgi:hypothetical protein
MLYLSGAKACICGVAEVLVPRKRFGSQIANPQNTIPQMTKIDFEKVHICGRSANLRSANCMVLYGMVW